MTDQEVHDMLLKNFVVGLTPYESIEKMMDLGVSAEQIDREWNNIANSEYVLKLADEEHDAYMAAHEHREYSNDEVKEHLRYNFDIGMSSEDSLMLLTKGYHISQEQINDVAMELMDELYLASLSDVSKDMLN